ncbi:pyridoxal-phosphate dependent enzyme [Rhizobium sp. CCGE531]|uniref:pyridoxal-phosphate dependent enzyme n=1 Tax=Rhizobium sp. CCGE531 TaxID=2364271 RepID=UPI001968BC38|nr:pyridoxal-phosphate dependent enzyme [Rhizobium sp. CCGE531]
MRNLEDFENPRIAKLSDGLYGASFFLMKLLPARFILERAVERGLLKPGATICESSSGTFGLALAMLAVQHGYKCILVSDWGLDRHLHRRLMRLGAHVEIVKEPALTGGIQQARLNRLAEFLKMTPNSYWPSQYSNPDNPLSYAKFAEQLIHRLGKIDCLVGPVGSGGSMCGTSKFLRVPFPDLHVVGVDTPNSVLFGQPIGTQEDLSGLGGEIIPSNVNHSHFNEVHWVTPAEVFDATHELLRDHSLYMGPTSGAAYKVADWWSRKNPEKKVVAIFPDEGHRYVETVYDEEWLSTVPNWSGSLRQQPVEVAAPTEELTAWSSYPWGRRTLRDVLSGSIERLSSQSVSPHRQPVNRLTLESDTLPLSAEAADAHPVTTLQELSPFDHSKVAHLQLEAEQEQFVDPLEASFLELRNASTPGLHHAFAIVARDETVGFFILREGAAVPEWAPPQVFTLHSLRVGRAYQGNGYGRAAAQLAAQWILANRPSIKRLMLGVNVRNVTARLVYLNAGFRDTDVTYQGPAGTQNIFELELV